MVKIQIIKIIILCDPCIKPLSSLSFLLIITFIVFLVPCYLLKWHHHHYRIFCIYIKIPFFIFANFSLFIVCLIRTLKSFLFKFASLLLLSFFFSFECMTIVDMISFETILFLIFLVLYKIHIIIILMWVFLFHENKK